ncbi:MAG: methionyl-tRNA formyltransferase [Candidatus Omnitrophica bacterium]|nr:methionyl-tRNA formyltransferase [Candidatus Omnitrophota bacterium]
MKIVFFGSSEFAVSSLESLYREGFSIVSVVTQPDKKSGRNLKVQPTPVKRASKIINLPVYEARAKDAKDFMSFLSSLDADFFVVVAYGNILKKELLAMPRYCCLNVHASLLPKYRGAAPVNWSIINGDRESGATIIRMNESVDCGDIVLQEKVAVSERDTSITLESKLANVGSALLVKSIGLIEKGRASYVAQDSAAASFAPKLKKCDGKIDWRSDTKFIINRIRGLKPWPGTYTFLDKQILKIIEAEEYEGDYGGYLPGQIIVSDEKTGLAVRTRDGSLLIRDLQMEGKRKMDSKLFIRGHKIQVGKKIG